MDNNEKMIYDLIKVYLAQMDSAMKISKTICEHSNRNELTGDDIICGLIYRLMKPMSQEEIDDSLQKAEDLLEDSTSEEEEYDCIEETYEIPKVTPLSTKDCKTLPLGAKLSFHKKHCWCSQFNY